MSTLPPEAVTLLRRGNAHLDAGAYAAAVPCFAQALERAPALAEAWFGLGGALVGLGRAGEAEEACHRGLRHAPAHPVGLSNLGAALSALGRHAAAQGCFEAALGRNPSFAQAHANLANALSQQNRVEAAHAAYERALSHAPDLLDARSDLADLLSRTGQITRACALASETARQFPDHPASQAARFDLLVRSARFTEARALASKAENRPIPHLMAASRSLMGLNMLPNYPAARVSAVHAAWGAVQAVAAGPERFAIDHNRDPERVLRVAYLSPDLRFHPVGRFLLPLLARHDKARVHVTCYDLAGTPDALTGQLADFTDHWRTYVGLGADEFAARIVSDRINILVDLAGHTHGQRLDVMARKPAPIQVTWLGYLNTTGLRAIDYRLSDAIADPPGSSEALSAEHLVRLPNFLCFAPPHDPPPVAPRPGQAGGVLTFGVCGRAEKIGHSSYRVDGVTWGSNPASSFGVGAGLA